MWIGYHEDLAKPSSSDEVSRQSTRVKCIVPLNGPTNLDPTWIRRVMGGPKQVHGSFKKMFGFEPAAELPSQRLEQVRESSPFHLVSASAPPTLLIYNGRNDVMPLPPSTSPGKLIHHPYFGEVLKQRLDELKVENELRIASDPRKNNFRDVIKWIDQQLAVADDQPTSE